MKDNEYYSKKTKKVSKVPILNLLGPIITRSIWFVVMLINGYYSRYDNLCEANLNPTNFFLINGWILFTLVIINIGLFVFRIIFYIIKKNTIIDYNKREPNNYKTDLLKYLYHKTYNQIQIINFSYKTINIILHLIVLGISSKIIDLLRKCDLNEWYYYFPPIAIIIITIYFSICDVVIIIDIIRYFFKPKEENKKPIKKNYNNEV